MVTSEWTDAPLSFPSCLVSSPAVATATHEQRAHWEIAGGGFGIHWPEIDEDLSTMGILRGAPAHLGISPRHNGWCHQGCSGPSL